MIKPDFRNKEAQKVWDDFFIKVDRKLKSLSPGERNELVTELKGHLMESMNGCDIDSEIGRLYHALEKLGDLDEFIKPIISQENEGKILNLPDAKEMTIKSAYSIYWLMSRSLYLLFIAAGYLIAVTIFLVALTKIFYPEQAGFFIKQNGVPIMGFNFENTGYSDPLGMWFVPIGLITGAAMFWGLWKLLRLALRR